MVTVMPFAGHVGPLRPVVAELVARGHEVRVHTGRRYLEPFRAAGARVVPWQAAADFDENDLPATFPAAQEGKGPRQMLGHLRHVFVGTAAGQARDLTAAWADEPWDVLLGDTTSFGAGLASELTGAPWASISMVPLTLPSRDLPPGGMGLTRDTAPRPRPGRRPADGHRRGPAGGAARPVRGGAAGGGPAGPRSRADGRAVPPAAAPVHERPRARAPAQRSARARPLRRQDGRPAAGRQQPPAWWDEVAQSDRPVVHVTQGTFNADPTQLLLPTLEALADDPVLVVATTGRAGSRSLPDAVPPNAHVTDLLPYSELLPRTTVMVTNGGWGGVTAALAHGVPLVVAGGDIDKPEIAARVSWSGAGIDLRTGTPTPAAVRDAVRSVLTGASFRAAAARVAAGFAAHDGPREAADLLEQLAAQQAPVRRPVAQLWG